MVMVAGGQEEKTLVLTTDSDSLSHFLPSFERLSVRKRAAIFYFHKCKSHLISWSKNSFLKWQMIMSHPFHLSLSRLLVVSRWSQHSCMSTDSEQIDLFDFLWTVRNSLSLTLGFTQIYKNVWRRVSYILLSILITGVHSSTGHCIVGILVYGREFGALCILWLLVYRIVCLCVQRSWISCVRRGVCSNSLSRWTDGQLLTPNNY